jgi:hypothetical protein
MLNKPEFMTLSKIRMALPVRYVPDEEIWRLGLIASLMKLRTENDHQVEDSE